MQRVITPSFALLLAVFFSLFTISQAAEAKRFGGGKSFGYSKSVPSKSFNKAPKAAPQAAPKAAPAAAGAKSRSGMMGMLGGLAAGGLLAAMFMGGGFEGIQIMDILLFALLGFVLFKLFRHFTGRQREATAQAAYDSPTPNRQAAPQPEEPIAPVQQREASPNSSPEYNPASGKSIFGANLGGAVNESASHVTEAPAWFQAEQFVDGAKGHFMTLQKAWDNADLSEVASYCSPELFEALKEEMQGQQAGENHTVVDTLDAEIADMVVDGEYFVVSIRFTGFIKEETAEDAHAFNEIWHIRRLANDEGTWQVAGIQQNP